jgi:hypothetical protein
MVQLKSYAFLIIDVLSSDSSALLCLFAHQVTYNGAFYGHNPLRSGHRFDGPDGASVLALFRDPRRRLTSAWNHGKHTHHLGTSDAESRFPRSRELLEKETPTLQDFARHRHVRGCQVKMLVGGQCGM